MIECLRHPAASWPISRIPDHNMWRLEKITFAKLPRYRLFMALPDSAYSYKNPKTAVSNANNPYGLACEFFKTASLVRRNIVNKRLAHTVHKVVPRIDPKSSVAMCLAQSVETVSLVCLPRVPRGVHLQPQQAIGYQVIHRIRFDVTLRNGASAVILRHSLVTEFSAIEIVNLHLRPHFLWFFWVAGDAVDC